MEPIPDDLKKVLEEKAPGIKRLADEAENKRMAGIVTGLVDFLADPDLLYLAVWYLTSRGLSVTILGQEKPPTIISTAN